MNIKEYLGDPIQIGVIVKNFNRVKENYLTILGVDNFREAHFPPDTGEDPKRMYYGRNGNFEANFYFFKWNNIELELIKPITGESIWKDYLSDGKEFGIHHIKFAVDRIEPLDKYFKSLGIEKIQQGAAVGPNAGKTWAFYGTMDRLGFDVEVINRIID